MHAWAFEASSPEEVFRLVRALGKHRYVKEVDHRIHWTVDQALAELPAFAPHAAAFAARRDRDRALEIASRDPSLWRPASVEEVVRALEAFWIEGTAAEHHRARLHAALAETGLEPAAHEAFACSPDEPPHPELILLDWVLLPVDELDSERHAGALAAMEDSGEEIAPSAPIYQEGPTLAAPELCGGAPEGALAGEFLIWSDGPYSYADYVFRGVTESAKLAAAPVGYRDL